MRRHKKHYRVMIELTGFAKNFDYLEEACEYAEKLAGDTVFEVVVWEVNPSAFGALDMYVPIFFYDGACEDEHGSENGTNVA